MWLPNVALILLCLYASPAHSCFLCKGYFDKVNENIGNTRNELLRSIQAHGNAEREIAIEMKIKLEYLNQQISALNPLKTQFDKMDQRLLNIESLISQRDAREWEQRQKTSDDHKNLETRLLEVLSDIKKTVSTETDKVSPAIKRQLSETEARLADQVAKLGLAINAMMIRTKDEAVIHPQEIQTMFAMIKNINGKIGDIESALNVLKKDLGKIRENPKEPLVGVISAVEEQTSMLNRVKELLEDTSKRIRELPKVSEVQTLHNETQLFLQETKHSLEDAIQRGIDQVGNKTSENKEGSKYNCCVSRSDFANNVEMVNKTLATFEKGQSVIFLMTDYVLDTRKKVDDGVQQILLEVGDLIKTQGNSLNNTLTQAFSNIAKNLTNNQNDCGLDNKMSKIKQEISDISEPIH